MASIANSALVVDRERRGLPAPVVTPPLGKTDITPPVVTLRSRHLRLNKKGVLPIPLACGAPETHCTGTLTLRAGKNGKRIHLRGICGTGSFRLRGGATSTVNVRLRRAALAALRKTGALQLVVAIAARDDSGNKTAAKANVRATGSG